VPLLAEERAEWESIMDDVERAVRSRPASPRVITTPFRRIPIPPVKPAMRSVEVDAAGRIWVNVYVQAEKRPESGGSSTSRKLTWRERSVYDVFGGRGDYLGRIRLEPQSRLLGSAGSTLWVSTVNANDEPLVVAYRLPVQAP
jgi:hypothetical protein